MSKFNDLMRKLLKYLYTCLFGKYPIMMLCACNDMIACPERINGLLYFQEIYGMKNLPGPCDDHWIMTKALSFKAFANDRDNTSHC